MQFDTPPCRFLFFQLYGTVPKGGILVDKILRGAATSVDRLESTQSGRS